MLRSVVRFGAARVAPALLSFALTTVLTHLLPASTFGWLTLATSSVALVSTLGFQWLVLALLRSVGGSTDRKAVLATALLTFGALSALTFLVAAASWFIVAPSGELRALVVVAAVLLLGQVWLDLNLQLAAADLSPTRYGMLGLLRAVVAMAVAIPLAILTGSAAAVLAGYALSYLLTGAWSMHRFWRGVRLRDASRTELGSLVRFGVPLSLQYGLETILVFEDRFILATVAGTAAAGAYAVGYDLSQQSLGMLMIIVNLAGYPLAMRAHDANDAATRDVHLHQQGRLLSAVSLPACAGLAVAAHAVAFTLFGHDFAPDAARVIPWISLAALLAGWKAFYFDLAFQLTRHTHEQVYIAGAAVALNTVLNLLLIPAAGIMGAALATAATYACSLLASAWYGRRHLVIPVPLRDGGRALLATAAMAAAVFPFRHASGPRALVVIVAVGAAVYACMAVVFNVADARRIGAGWMASAGLVGSR